VSPIAIIFLEMFQTLSKSVYLALRMIFQIKFNVCCCPLLSVSGSVKIIANGFCYGACRIFTSMFFDLYYFQIFNFLSKFLQPEECTIIHCNRIFVIKLVIISTEIFPVLNRVCL